MKKARGSAAGPGGCGPRSRGTALEHDATGAHPAVEDAAGINADRGVGARSAAEPTDASGREVLVDALGAAYLAGTAGTRPA